MMSIFSKKNNFVFFSMFFFSFLGYSPVYAHKVITELYVSGDTIEGEIGFSDGSMVKGETVEVFDGDNNKLGETKTNDDGFFTYKVTKKVYHVFRANLGAGHIAEAQIGADELPEVSDATVEIAPTTSSATGTDTSKTNVSIPSDQNSKLSTSPGMDTSLIQGIVTEAVRKEVRPLQREIAAYREKNDLQSILGGIGYILGLFGIAFYIAARQKSAQGL